MVDVDISMLVSQESFNPFMLEMMIMAAVTNAINDGQIGPYAVPELQEIAVQAPLIGMCASTLKF